MARNRTILICQGTGCVSSKSFEIGKEFQKEIKEHSLTDIIIKGTGCHGFCQIGPIVIIEPEGYLYCYVKPEDVSEITESHLKNNQPVERLFYIDPKQDQKIPKYKDIDFYKKQERIILRNCGHIDPEEIDDYINAGGYKALAKVLRSMTSEDVINEVKKSGLAGRGGAGFPTGKKWEFCHMAKGSSKYMVCNADEGDPGAFMDRSILEADPHAALEGMLIAAYAIGAEQGYIYCRAEYPLALVRLRIAIKQMEAKGFLGKNIQGSKFNFRIKIFEGAGAFVCGEETALLASIEGKRGMPRPRPPYPAFSGLWQKPTTINNVKTLATVPVIINKGADWFMKIGSSENNGTVIFAITGNIANCGLLEVPMGTSLRKIVYDIGGGIPKGKKLKAVQTGGPSGGCLPAAFLDHKVDYKTLTKAGSMMGSGGMVVMDEDTCMVDIARFFLDFTQKESCGSCVPCRLGTKQMLQILEDITAGRGREGDIELLEELGRDIKSGSLCGLGQTAPNPVLSTIRYFRKEYEAHIQDKKCPAKACKPLLTYNIIDACIGCGACARVCPSKAITGEKKQKHQIDQELCVKCGHCYQKCKFEAITKE